MNVFILIIYHYHLHMWVNGSVQNIMEKIKVEKKYAGIIDTERLVTANSKCYDASNINVIFVF